jgi:hypothetical protein
MNDPSFDKERRAEIVGEENQNLNLRARNSSPEEKEI